MFKSMLFFLFYSCCFAQPVEKIVDQNETILPGAELMDLSFSSLSDGNNVEEILKQLSAVLTYDLRQTQNIMKAIKTEMVKMKDEFNDLKETIVDNSNTISEVNMIAERNYNQVNQQEALTMNNMVRLNSMANKVVDIKDKMANMEEMIVNNSDNISDVKSTITIMSEEEVQQEKRINSLKNSDLEQETRIDSLKNSDLDHKTRIESLQNSDQEQAAQIQSLATTGTKMAEMEEEIIRNSNTISDMDSTLSSLQSNFSSQLSLANTNILRNEKKIEQVDSTITVFSQDLECNKADAARVSSTLEESISDVSSFITKVAEDVKSLSSTDQQQAAQIQSIGTRGTWCGFKSTWSSVGTITYESLTFSDSNMNTATPLDINTGIFNVPVSGVWRVTFSMRSYLSTYGNVAYLYINGGRVDESQHYTSSHSDGFSTSGREVTREFIQGDNIELRTTSMDNGYYQYINYCAEYIPKL